MGKECALITDGRFSGGTSGLSIGHISPEAANGGNIGKIKDGDIIVIDIPSRSINVKLSDEELAAMAVQLGADCAFFIYNRPMLATGIGDVLTPVDVTLKGKTLLLVKPPVGVDTRTAYSRVKPQVPLMPLTEIISRPLPGWDGLLVNDFEPSVFAVLPQLWLIKAQILDAGAQYAAMSGSGSTVFGIFDNDKLAESTADTIADCATFVLQL